MNKVSSSILILIVLLTCIYGCSVYHRNPFSGLTDGSGSGKGIEYQEDLENLNSIEKAINKDSSSVALRLEAADILLKVRKEAGEDWINRALYHYLEALSIDSLNIEVRWGVASTLEYCGYYEEAARHYWWLKENIDNEIQPVQKANTHHITCQVLANLGEGIEGYPNPENIGADVNDECMKKRSKWDELTSFVAAVSLATGVDVIGGSQEHVQVSLGLLEEWQNAPRDQKVSERNDLLAGMVSVICSIVLENNLIGPVNNLLISNNMPTIYNYPTKGYAKQLHHDFAEINPPKGKTIKISDDLSISVEWDVPQIAGTWIFNHKMVSSSIQYDLPPSAYSHSREYDFIQEGGRVALGPNTINSINQENAKLNTKLTIYNHNVELVGNEMRIYFEQRGPLGLIRQVWYSLRISGSQNNLMTGTANSSTQCREQYGDHRWDVTAMRK